jgi:hypothetical protein
LFVKGTQTTRYIVDLLHTFRKKAYAKFVFCKLVWSNSFVCAGLRKRLMFMEGQCHLDILSVAVEHESLLLFLGFVPAFI